MTLGPSAAPWQGAEPLFPPKWKGAKQNLLDDNYHHHNVEGNEIQLCGLNRHVGKSIGKEYNGELRARVLKEENILL